MSEGIGGPCYYSCSSLRNLALALVTLISSCLARSMMSLRFLDDTE